MLFVNIYFFTCIWGQNRFAPHAPALVQLRLKLLKTGRFDNKNFDPLRPAAGSTRWILRSPLIFDPDLGRNCLKVGHCSTGRKGIFD